MIKPFAFYGITRPSVLALETEHGPALSSLPEKERRNIAAALLVEEGGMIAYHSRESFIAGELTQLPPAFQLAAVRAIINTL